MSENRLPNLPNSPMTTGELGLVFFDLAPDAQYRLMSNLLTKTNVPRNIRSLYTRALVVAGKIQSPVMMDYLFKDLMLRVSENEKRMKDFANQFALELHRQTSRKEEEKPKI